ncbi:MAG: helix-turn-helix domain-containing protein [Intrasporangium sp.]|uniref:helix-turn-helix domain-containing protein n=1 Tax=Intrasporangium sp. TaxID=1925024 RepID=UPI003F7F6FC4
MSIRFSAERYVVRARRLADLSQRELAEQLGISRSIVSRLETGEVVPSTDLLSRIMAIAGLRLVVVDSDGALVDPVSEHVARDNAGRRYPAHLDVNPVEMAPAAYLWRPRRERHAPRAWFQLREERDRRRAELPSIDDHPTVGDLAAYRRMLFEQKAARMHAQAAARAATEPTLPDCSCGLECEESGPCVPSCGCQCEPPVSNLA